MRFSLTLIIAARIHFTKAQFSRVLSSTLILHRYLLRALNAPLFAIDVVGVGWQSLLRFGPDGDLLGYQ